jgi:hypothetical protein
VADADTADRVQASLLADPDIYARHVDVVIDRASNLASFGGNYTAHELCRDLPVREMLVLAISESPQRKRVLESRSVAIERF